MGTGRFLGPQRVEVAQNDRAVRELTSKRTFIDTGTRPAIPGLPGLSDIPFLTSDTIQHLDAVPSRLLVLVRIYWSRVWSDDASVREQGYCL